MAFFIEINGGSSISPYITVNQNSQKILFFCIIPNMELSSIIVLTRTRSEDARIGWDVRDGSEEAS